MAFSDLYLDPAQQLPPVPDPETGFPPIIPQAPPMPPQVPGAQPPDFGNEQAAYQPPELPDFGNEQAAYQAPQAAPNPWEAWSAQNAERMRQQAQEEAQKQRELQDQIRRMEMAQGGMRLTPAEIVQLRRQMDLQRATLSQSEEQRLGRLQGGESVVQQDMANGIITREQGSQISQMIRELTEPLLIRRSQLPVMQARMQFIQQMQQMQQRAEVENRYSQYLAQTAQQRVQTVTLPDGSTIPLYIHADGSMHQLTPPRTTAERPAITPQIMTRITGRIDTAMRQEERRFIDRGQPSPWPTQQSYAQERMRRIQESVDMITGAFDPSSVADIPRDLPPPPTWTQHQLEAQRRLVTNDIGHQLDSEISAYHRALQRANSPMATPEMRQFAESLRPAWYPAGAAMGPGFRSDIRAFRDRMLEVLVAQRLHQLRGDEPPPQQSQGQPQGGGQPGLNQAQQAALEALGLVPGGAVPNVQPPQQGAPSLGAPPTPPEPTPQPQSPYTSPTPLPGVNL